MEAPRVVIDTNVLAGALLRNGGANRSLLRACLDGRLQPLVGQALFLEYQDVLARRDLFRGCPLSTAERQQFFEAFLSVCEWVPVYFLWRPNLRDEGDNHLLEVAVAGEAAVLVTNNVRDFRDADLRFPQVRVRRPAELLKELV